MLIHSHKFPVDGMFASLELRLSCLSSRQWLLLMLFLFASWSGAFVYLTFNPDNYLHLYQLAAPRPAADWFELGRPLMSSLYMIIFQGSLQPPLQLLLGLLAFLLCCLEISLLWRLSQVEAFFLCMFALAYPFLVNIFGFETGKFSVPLGFLLSLYGFRLCQSKRFDTCIYGVILASLGFSFYQNSINFLVVVTILSISFNFLGFDDSGFATFQKKSTYFLSLSRAFILSVFLGGFLYVILAEVVRRTIGVGYNPRYSAINGWVDATDLYIQTREILAHYKYFLYLDHPLLTRWFTMALAFSYLVILFFSLRTFLQRKYLLRLSFWISLLSLCVAHIAVWSTDYVIPGSLLGSGYRHVFPVAFVFAGVSLYSLRLIRKAALRSLWWLLMGLCLLSFAVTDQSWAFNTNRLYYFDRAQLLRIAVRIEASNYYRPDLPVLIVGLLPHSSRPVGLQSKGFDVYGSALEWPGIARIALREQGFVNPEPSTASQSLACKKLRDSMSESMLSISQSCAVVNLSNIP